ncbi:MAG TPA: riboflavin synthase [Acidimicrobiaceae bacterium]|nr:riboflavin synthase [Acidimicrobiaceae bacterium]
MFTGIVEELGSVISRVGPKLRLAASVVLNDVELGASIAVNGCCLTVVDFELPTESEPGWWEADVSEESYLRTNLGGLSSGDPVNLERPVRVSDRLGGHLVQGHVDAVGIVQMGVPNLVVSLPEGLSRYVVEKGSITVDGVSLTVVEAFEDGFSAAVIPHTASVTTLGVRRPGEAVNLEVDVTAKYIERLIAAQLGALNLGASPGAEDSEDSEDSEGIHHA